MDQNLLSPIPPHPDAPAPELGNKPNYIIIFLGVGILMGTLIASGYIGLKTLGMNNSKQPRTSNSPVGQQTTTNLTFDRREQITAQTSAQKSTVTQLKSNIDLTKLPLGDNKTSTSAKKGYVYTCQTNFNGGGAETKGPWINISTNTWDLTKKLTVDGNVLWSNAEIKVSSDGTSRTITSNDLPDHHTGVYPIQQSDDAYQYDKNPNSIKTQTMTFKLPANPTMLATPQCVGGEVGIALSGVLIFNAFDAGGRDAVATEIQDTCEGHPQKGGYYHYHGYSDCLEENADKTKHSELLGYAFDGFGIYGIHGENGTELSSNDLDECHGHTHTITWDGKQVSMYHYHLTQDFPYTVGCFRGQPAVRGISNEGSMPGREQQGNMRPSDRRPPPPGGQNSMGFPPPQP